MNGVVKKILNDVILLAKSDVNDKISINAIHYMMALNATLKRAKVKLHDGKEFDLNYYGITFSQSGSSKDWTLSTVQKLFKNHMNDYRQALVAKTAEAISEDGMMVPNIITKEGTTAGIRIERQILDVCKIGSTNIKVEELVSVMKTPTFHELMEMLTESWSEGSNDALSRKSALYPAIKNVPMNCLMYSSPSGFRHNNNKSFNDFSDTLANGFARRSYMVFVEDVDATIEDEPTLESIKLDIENSKKSLSNMAELSKYFDEILSGHGMNKVISLPDDSYLRLKKYEIENKNKVINNPLIKDAIKAERLNRWFKTIRLAALYAFYDGSDSVSVENIEDAIEWAEMLNKDLSIVLNAETTQEKIYDFLIKAGKYSSETDIRKYLNITATDFRESKAELFTVAYDAGSVIQEKVFDNEGRVRKYNVIHGKKTTSDNMICSASNHTAKDFKPLSLGFKQLPNLIRGEYGKNYSPGQFVDSYRKKDNFIQKSNLIMFDIDDGTTLDDAKILLSNYRGYIATTRSHQKDKHGVVCDRFRVILVSKFEFNLSVDEHKSTMKNMAEFIGLEIDYAAVDVARFYFSHDGDIFNLPGESLVDLRDYIEESKPNEERKVVMKDVDKKLNSQLDYDPKLNYNRFDVWCLRNATVGSRNITLRNTFKALWEHTDMEAYDAAIKVKQLNSMLLEPLSDSEIDLVCREGI